MFKRIVLDEKYFKNNNREFQLKAIPGLIFDLPFTSGEIYCISKVNLEG